MAVINKHTRNSTVLLLTSLGIIAFLLFYIFSYIPKNEERINERSYRVLQRVGSNMNTSVVNYSRYVGNSFVSDAVSKVFPSRSPSQADSLYINYKSLLDTLKLADHRELLTAKFGLRFYFEEKDNGKTDHIENEDFFHYLQEKGQLYLHFPSKINSRTYNDLRKRRIQLASGVTDSIYHIKVPVDSLLNSLMRWDTFKHLIVLANKETPSETGGKKATNQAYKIIYNSRETADLVPLDTLIRLANRSTGAGPVDVGIAGIPYKLFTITQRVGPSERWYLYGTIPAEKYDTESRAIPAEIISFSALAVALLLMAFPFLKLVLMNQHERLFRQDLIFSFLSLFNGVALMVLLLFNVYSYYGVDRYAERTGLEKLSTSLQQNLKKEINLLISQMQDFDKAPSDLEDFKLPDNHLYWKNVEDSRIIKKNDNYFPYFQRVFWIDSTGLMSCSWAVANQNNAKVRVHYRNYFKVINNGGGYSLGNSPKFVLESITSNTDGEKYAVISMRSQRESNRKSQFRVVALATKLTSLSKAILPVGYGFCLIDKEGKVLFHQNENLNQNESLLEETDQNPHLKAALYGQVPAHFTHIYQGNPQQLFVSPVDGLPFYLVTYVNDNFHKAFNVNLLVLTALFISLYLFSIAILTALIIYLNEGLFNISFSWLWPRKNATHHYFKIILALSCIMLLALLLANIDYQVSTYFVYVQAAMYAFIYIYSNLNRVSFLRVWFRSWPVILGFSGICLLVSLTAFFSIILFQVLLIIILVLLDKQAEKPNLNQNSKFFVAIEKNLPYQRSYHYLYVGMLTSWFIMASGLPAFVLFRVAYNYEAELMVRYNQVYLAQILNNIKQPTLPEDENLPVSTAIYYANFFYHTKFHKQSNNASEPRLLLKEFSYTSALPASNHKQITKAKNNNLPLAVPANLNQETNNETVLLNNFIPVFRPIFRNVLSDAYFLKDNNVDDWKLIGDNLWFDYPNRDGQLLLFSHMPAFQVPYIFYRTKQSAGLMQSFNKSGWFFWIDIIILIILLYLLISFLISHAFNIDLVSKIQRNQWELKVLNLANKNNLFLLSFPHSPDIKETIKRENKDYDCYFAEFDLNLMVTVLEPAAIKNKLKETIEELNNSVRPTHSAAKFLIVHNFDFDPFSKASLELKIYLLNYLANSPDLKIILQSSISPWHWEEQLKEEELKAEQGAGDAAYRLMLQELLRQLTTYLKTYQPLQPDEYETELETAFDHVRKVSSEKELTAAIENECAAATYLEAQFKGIMVNFLKENHEKMNFNRSDIIMRLQRLAQLYYRGLWHACTEEEKYFLFDMAQDGLVNSKNVHVLSSLLGKGLLVTDKSGLLKIMNESFRYFILTVVSRADALRFEKNNAQDSRWSMYKTPLVLILIGAVLFFFFTQKASWANIIAILTAISSVAAILPRLTILLPSFLVGKENKS